MKISLLIAVISILLTTSCASYVVQPLPLPSEAIARPSEASLDCLDENTYEIIVKSYKRIQTLENIIKSTH